MKVDARQMENQGPRYRARAAYRQATGDWDEFRCILIAPQRYLDSAYPPNGWKKDGWDQLVSFEDLINFIPQTLTGAADAEVIFQSTKNANSWNMPIPEAVMFWGELEQFQKSVYPDVPISVNRQRGAGIFVWPSFYEKQLASNPNEIRRRRVQIVHSGKTHVALYIKKVRPEPFFQVVQPLLEEGVHLGKAGGSWQSVMIRVPYVDPQQPFEKQIDMVGDVFGAARKLYDFFLEHEHTLLSIPTFK
jgi:hypothetical protein